MDTGKDMKRVVIIAHGLGDGGAERVASLVANHFDTKGMKVLFIAVYHNSREYPIADDIEYRYIDVHGKKGMAALWERNVSILKLAKSFQADVAVSFVEHEITLLAISNIDVIPSLRNDPKSTERGLLLKMLRDFNYRRSKKIIFQTEGAKNYFSKKIREKGIIIRNPLKTDLPLWREDNHKKIFMTACRISTQKNLPMLIKAFSSFYTTHREYSLEIYGDGSVEYQTQLEALAEELGVKSTVHFKGHSTQIHKYMCQSEAFILSSDYEGLSNSMLEAMAIGVPCICTDCPSGGAREVMETRNAGILVPVGDDKALANAMQRIAQSPELRTLLSDNEKYIRKELCPETIFDYWDKALN